MNKKLGKILTAVGRIKPGSVLHVAVEHDEGCPALKTHNLNDCTCRPDVKKMAPSQNGVLQMTATKSNMTILSDKEYLESLEKQIEAMAH